MEKQVKLADENLSRHDHQGKGKNCNSLKKDAGTQGIECAVKLVLTARHQHYTSGRITSAVFFLRSA